MSENLETIKVKKIEIEIGGKTRCLCYDLNAFAELEEAYGSFDKMLAALQAGSIKAVRKFLYAGFIHEDESITEKEVGSWFDLSSIDDLSAKINMAMTLALPKQEDAPVAETTDPNVESPAK